jgi:hypothetical protein
MAADLNREEQAKGTRKRFVVVADPIGSLGGRHQLVPRRIGAVNGSPEPAQELAVH